MKKNILKLLFVGLTTGIFSLSSYSQVTLQWAKNMGGADSEWGYSIAVDASGNVYTTGNFANTADFDPGAGISNLTSGGSVDIFITKLDAAGNFMWARGMGGAGVDYGYSIAVDASGNVYTAGYFQVTSDFDPGSGTSNLTSAGGPDIFISKLDAAGNFVWAKRMGGLGDDVCNSIAVDASGNVYTTGSFEMTADFDPGAGTFNLTAAGGNVDPDFFISKLDVAGNFVWAKRMGGISSDNSYSIAIDATGNVYTTGIFVGTVDFDPGAGASNLVPVGYSDIFISKLDATGNFVWAKGLGGLGDGVGVSIVLDASGNVYTVGRFQATSDFDPGAGTSNLTSAGLLDIFISKLDVAGNFVWAKGMGGLGQDICYSMAVDVFGNVYTTGYFRGTSDFDPGAGISNLTSGASNDIFISKLDAAGNFVWAKGIGGALDDYGMSIAVDASGNVYSTGSFQNTVDFDPGAGTSNLTSAGINDIFVHKMSQNPVGLAELNSASIVYVYPNPCINKATVSFSLSHPAKIDIKLFDVDGRLISILAEKMCEEGVSEFTWNAEAMEAGIYFLSMQSDEFKHTERIIVLK